MYLAYVSKDNSIREKQVVVLMIPNGEGWNYIEVKKLPALLRGITWKHYANFYCLNWFYSFRTENKLESHKKVCENKDFWDIVMSSEDA